MKYLFLIVTTFLCIILLEWFWFSFIGFQYYESIFDTMRHPDANSYINNTTALLLTYLLLTFYIFFFIHLEYTHKPLGWNVFFRGLLFGFFLFGIMNLSNLTVMHQWTFHLSVIDTVWGMFLTAVCTAFPLSLTRYFCSKY